MKKIILILGILICNHSFGQNLVVTQGGLKDASNLEQSYLALEVGGTTAQELYDNAIKYITEKYKNPEEVIKGKTIGEYLKFDTYVADFLVYRNSGIKMPIEARFTTELRFKDGRVKYEITSLEMPCKTSNFNVEFTGSIMSGYIIYKKNGKLYKEKTKNDIETYFNSSITELLTFLKGDNNSGDW